MIEECYLLQTDPPPHCLAGFASSYLTNPHGSFRKVKTIHRCYNLWRRCYLKVPDWSLYHYHNHHHHYRHHRYHHEYVTWQCLTGCCWCCHLPLSRELHTGPTMPIKQHHDDNCNSNLIIIWWYGSNKALTSNVGHVTSWSWWGWWWWWW